MPHDLRSTVMSHRRALGVPRDISQMCLNHKLSEVEGSCFWQEITSYNDALHNFPSAQVVNMHRAPLLVDLALQGGGAHGAFTWGVMDRLIEEPWLKIEGISGTSAGAMNAAVMASGLEHGGVDGAKAALEDFWKRVSDA